MIYRTPRPELQQESDVLSARALLWALFLTVAIVIGLVLVARRITTTTEQSLRPSAQFPERTQAPPPRSAQGNLEQGLFGQRGIGQAVQRVGARELERWRWVNRDRRLVAIPIERAMDAWVERETK